jgi:hypothetical protein
VILVNNLPGSGEGYQQRAGLIIRILAVKMIEDMLAF